MTVILTSGDEFSGYKKVHHTLERAGVKKSKLSTEQFGSIDEIEARAEINRSSDDRLYRNAVNLFTINSDQNVWGWSQSDIEQLDFWAKFDLSIHFVLVYSLPELTLNISMESSNLSVDDINSRMNGWLSSNEKLLRFYYKYTKRCTLVNSVSIINSEAKLIDKLSQFATLKLDADFDSPSTVCQYELLTSVFSKYLISEHHKTAALYFELESAADFPMYCDGNISQTFSMAWNDFLLFRKELNFARNELINYSGFIKNNDIEIAALTKKLTEQSVEISELTEDEQRSNTILCEKSLHLLHLEQENERLNAENQLLLYQLQDSQEVIDAFSVPFAKTDPIAESATKPELKSEIFVNMLGDIDGDNWYYAEHDGRWAGPDSVSKLRTEVLQAGEYEVRFDVVDAIEKKILSETMISLNGIPLKVSRKGRGVTGLIFARFSTENIPSSRIWEFELKFSKLVSPSQFGSIDSRVIAIRVRSMQVVQVY